MHDLVESLVMRRLAFKQLVGHSHHAAAVLPSCRHPECSQFFAYGENVCRPPPGTEKSIHAEHDAISKLPTLSEYRFKRHKKRIDLLVIRASKTGCLGMSRPCYHCLLLMTALPPKKGYQIHRIYYSDETGNIVEATLESLLREQTQHISKYYRI
jgi:cytidine deaminase